MTIVVKVGVMVGDDWKCIRANAQPRVRANNRRQDLAGRWGKPKDTMNWAVFGR